MSAQAAATTVPAIESDLEVLGRHLAGDERAFAELYRRFGGLVFNLLNIDLGGIIGTIVVGVVGSVIVIAIGRVLGGRRVA